LREDLRKAVGIFVVWLVVLVIGWFVIGGVLYLGITGVPSNATYLANYNNLDTIKVWDNFKTTQPQLDPSLLVSNPLLALSGVSVNVSAMSATEEILQPKTVVPLHVSVSTVLSNSYSLKLPSLVIFLLDQNDRIRGKVYTQQSSPDFFIAGQNQTDYTFWFKVPSDMQNQPIRIIVELFGIVDYSSSINYQNIYSNVNDAVYGSFPQWQYPLSGSYFRLMGSDTIETHTPAVYSIINLAIYSWGLAGVISTFVPVGYWLKGKSEDWWKRNKMYAIFGILFLITYIVILVIVGMIL
jgi:hypothetical protein